MVSGSVRSRMILSHYTEYECVSHTLNFGRKGWLGFVKILLISRRLIFALTVSAWRLFKGTGEIRRLLLKERNKEREREREKKGTAVPASLA